MVIPTEYITLSGTDKTTEGKYQKKTQQQIRNLRIEMEETYTVDMTGA